MEAAFRYFERIVELGSIRKASDALHLSPSSISRQIARLEHSIGTPLLVRQAQGVRLTEAGEVVWAFLRGRSREFQRLKASIDALRNLDQGHVTIHTVEGMISGLLARTIAAFSERYPGISYEIFSAGTEDVMQALVEDRCDIGLTFQPHRRREVEVLHGVAQPLLAVMSADHPLAGRKQIDIRELVSEKIGLPSSTFGIRQMVDHALAGEGMSLDVRLTTNSIDLLRQFATRRLGIVFLPVFSFERELLSGDLIGVPLARRRLALSTMQICKRADIELAPAARRFAELLIERSSDYGAVAKIATG